MFTYIIRLPRNIKTLILLAVDLMLVVFAYYLSFVLRLSDLWPEFWITKSLPLLALLLVSAILFTYTFKLHRTKLLGYETRAAMRSALWVTAVALTGFFGVFVLGLNTPRTIPFIFGILMFLFVFGSRYVAIAFLDWLRDKNSAREPIAVYGAGEAGIQMVSALRSSSEYSPKLFADDNRSLQGLIISGLMVHKPSDLSKLVNSGKITKVLMAIPSLSVSKKMTW